MCLSFILRRSWFPLLYMPNWLGWLSNLERSSPDCRRLQIRISQTFNDVTDISTYIVRCHIPTTQFCPIFRFLSTIRFLGTFRFLGQLLHLLQPTSNLRGSPWVVWANSSSSNLRGLDCAWRSNFSPKSSLLLSFILLLATPLHIRTMFSLILPKVVPLEGEPISLMN